MLQQQLLIFYVCDNWCNPIKILSFLFLEQNGTDCSFLRSHLYDAKKNMTAPVTLALHLHSDVEEEEECKFTQRSAGDSKWRDEEQLLKINKENTSLHDISDCSHKSLIRTKFTLVWKHPATFSNIKKQTSSDFLTFLRLLSLDYFHLAKKEKISKYTDWKCVGSLNVNSFMLSTQALLSELDVLRTTQYAVTRLTHTSSKFKSVNHSHISKVNLN